MSGDPSAPRFGRAALLGWTNVGKSTLLNRLVGAKLAAVSEAPQTTRSRILGVRSVEGRGQVAFVDTPGLHEPRFAMNRAMVEAARRVLHEVDLIVLVVDAARGLGEGDGKAAAAARRAGGARLAALNKVDRVTPKSRLLPMMRTVVEDWGFSEAVPVSALTGEGCDLLLDRILALLPEGSPQFPEDYLTDQPERSLAGEWIREKLLQHTRQEIPHATAVIVDRWEERPDGIVAIDATIVVDRESQKAIVIGREGALLKRIGTEARADIERLLDARVYLRLWVRARPRWRDDDRALRELGLL